MKANSFIQTFIFSLIVVNFVCGQSLEITPCKAAKYFKMIDSCSRADNTQLWGETLHGKLMIVDPKTYEMVTNYNVKDIKMKKQCNLYIGKLPKNQVVANTSFQFKGQTWTMVIWPLPNSKVKALEILAHESFHSIQNNLGFTQYNPTLQHMDKLEARILFRLEMNALYAALWDNPKAIEHAIKFRKMRFDLFPEGSKQETKLESNEGLAQYTGYKLAYLSEKEKKQYQTQQLNMAESAPGLSRATAYISGPLYGELLDKTNKKWQQETIPIFDIMKLSKTILAIDDAKLQATDYNTVKHLYGFDTIQQFEQKRAQTRLKMKKVFLKKLVEESPLILPLENMRIQFTPTNMFPLAEKGSVYPQCIVKASFGTLHANKGALMWPNWNKISVSKPDSVDQNMAYGAGWKIELNKGFSIIKDDLGNYKLIKR